MNTIQMGCAKPLPCHPGCAGSIAYNGCGFARLDPHAYGVIRMGRNLCPAQTVRTVRQYKNICYDMMERCWWATASERTDLLYRLDGEFRELARLTLTGGCRRCPSGISCDPCGNTLLLLFPGAIEQVDKATGHCVRQPLPGRARLAVDLLALCGGYIISYLEQEHQFIEVTCNSCDRPTVASIPQDRFLEGMFLRGISRNTKGGTCYDVGLLLSRCHGQEWVEIECTVTCCGQPTPILPCPPPCPPPPHPPLDPCCGAYEVIHSVALEEAGIAHILNAEGEKLQKAVATCKNIQELLCVNESVRRTISQITLLEGQLYSKLEAISACLGPNPCACGSEQPHKCNNYN